MTATATEPGAEGVSGEWVDVRMTDPEEGEWTVDAVVIDGHAEYLDLRVRREVLPSFVACLLGDLDKGSAERVLADAAELLGVGSCVDDE